MKNSSEWSPTKYEMKNGRLRGSRNPKFLTLSSRLVADITANYYQEYLPTYAKGKLADLGCGNVPLYILYKDYVSESICADWPNTTHKNKFLDVECDLNTTLPFSANEFDTIILSDVLEHLRKPELLIQEMYRILQPGGKVILNVPFFYKLHETPFDYYRYTKYTLKNFADDARFKVLALHEMGGLIEILGDLTAKLITNLPLIGKFCASIIQSFTRWFLSTQPGKKLTLKTKAHYPLGYFVVLEK